MPVTYCSTRGGEKGVSFEDVVLGGLAPDKGLYVPEQLPKVSLEEIEKWRTLDFADLAHKVMSQFISPEEVPSEDLERLLHASTSNFRDADVTPLVKVGNVWVLELFHGPTFAFKDVALQFLGNLFEFFLLRRRARGEEARMTVLGATSGDTGSAAIYGLRGKKHVDCFIMFPTGRVSEIQERQMTTVPDENIHCLSIEGTFDDCQAIVKGSFNDPKFKSRVKLGAVNSINWARVLAQMTYYFWSVWLPLLPPMPQCWMALGGTTIWLWTKCWRIMILESGCRSTCPPHASGHTKPLLFTFLSGNFGDILAGFYAKQMGLPIGDMLVATNENDILHRFFTTGKYWREKFISTLAPSMDICVSSNFERYLFHLCGNDATQLKSWMDNFEKTGKLTVDGKLLDQAKADFVSAAVHTDDNLGTIKAQWEDNSYLLCPHSSIGYAAAVSAGYKDEATVVLATAHPGKFPTAVSKVVDPLPDAPPELEALWSMPTRKTELPNNKALVQSHMVTALGDSIPAAAKCPFPKVDRKLAALVVIAAVAAAAAVAVGVKRRK
ncbi:unnamed protein product [Chrysoparadoxa australica]